MLPEVNSCTAMRPQLSPLSVTPPRLLWAAKKAAACVCVQRLSSGRKARLWRLQRLLLLFREETRKRVGRKRRLCLLKCSKHFFSLEFFLLLLLLCNIQYKTLYCRQYLKSTFCWGKITILLLSSKKELVCFWILEMLWMMDLRLVEQGFYSFSQKHAKGYLKIWKSLKYA